MLTIPLVFGWLVATWWRLPAPRRLKRRHILRTTAIQTAAVALGVGGIFITRPNTLPLLSSAPAVDGRVGYAFQFEGNCDLWVAVSEGPYGIRVVSSSMGPFPCDGPPPTIAWRGKIMVLLDPDGKEVGRWFDED